MKSYPFVPSVELMKMFVSVGKTCMKCVIGTVQNVSLVGMKIKK